jgi:hypothetical protein
MRNPQIDKKLFKIALASAGISLSEYARRVGVSHAMVHMILSGKSWSRKVETGMKGFISVHLKKLRIVDLSEKQKAAA